MSILEKKIRVYRLKKRDKIIKKKPKLKREERLRKKKIN